MREVDRLKKRMVREAVRENREALDAKLYLKKRFRAPRWKWLVRGAVAVVVPLALFVSINAISTGSAAKTEVVVVPPKIVAPPAGVEPSALRAPRAIDPTVFRLKVATVVIDAGHGGSDPGASRLGVLEKDVTLDVARRLRDLLADGDLKVLLTRDDDRFLSLRDRALLANGERADLFVSIHVNSLPLAGRRGVETYYLGPADDPHVDTLAGEENRQSGYSLADFRKLLEGVFAGVRQTESRAFAEAVQASLVSSLRRADPELPNRGVKSAPFVVLVATEMPGILAEVSCLSNDEEARRLKDPSHRQAIAQALAVGVKAYAATVTQPTPRPETTAARLSTPKKKGTRSR